MLIISQWPNIWSIAWKSVISLSVIHEVHFACWVLLVQLLSFLHVLTSSHAAVFQQIVFPSSDPSGFNNDLHMLELGPVPGDLLLLRAFYPFANNINALLCTAVFTYECGQIASAEKDGVREYCSKRAGELSFGQASSIMLKPDVERCFLLVTWAPLVRHLHKCHLYSSQCGRESGNGGPAARSGKMKSAVGSKLPSTTSVCSFSANMSETCRRQLFAAVLLCHCVTCSVHSTWQTCCVCNA